MTAIIDSISNFVDLPSLNHVGFKSLYDDSDSIHSKKYLHSSFINILMNDMAIIDSIPNLVDLSIPKTGLPFCVRRPSCVRVYFQNFGARLIFKILAEKAE